MKNHVINGAGKEIIVTAVKYFLSISLMLLFAILLFAIIAVRRT